MEKLSRSRIRHDKKRQNMWVQSLASNRHHWRREKTNSERLSGQIYAKRMPEEQCSLNHWSWRVRKQITLDTASDSDSIGPQVGFGNKQGIMLRCAPRLEADPD